MFNAFWTEECVGGPSPEITDRCEVLLVVMDYRLTPAVLCSTLSHPEKAFHSVVPGMFFFSCDRLARDGL